MKVYIKCPTCDNFVETKSIFDTVVCKMCGFIIRQYPSMRDYDYAILKTQK